MNAIVVPAAKKKIVVVGDPESGYRHAKHSDVQEQHCRKRTIAAVAESLTKEQREGYRRIVATIDFHRPEGLQVGIVVPFGGALIGSCLANHFRTQPTECESLMSDDSPENVLDACDCLRELLSARTIGIVCLVVQGSAVQAIAEALRQRLHRTLRSQATAAQSVLVL